MSKAEQDVVFAQWSKENKDYMVVMWDEEKYAKRVCKKQSSFPQ